MPRHQHFVVVCCVPLVIRHLGSQSQHRHTRPDKCSGAINRWHLYLYVLGIVWCRSVWQVSLDIYTAHTHCRVDLLSFIFFFCCLAFSFANLGSAGSVLSLFGNARVCAYCSFTQWDYVMLLDNYTAWCICHWYFVFLSLSSYGHGSFRTQTSKLKENGTMQLIKLNW